MTRLLPEPAAGYRLGVGAMLTSADGRVFVARRIDMPSEAWQMPQGGVDKGEDPRRAILRELEEETGVPPRLVTVEAETPGWLAYDLPDELRAKLWGGRYRGQCQRWFRLRFHGTDADIDLATEHPEFSDWRWVRPAETVDLIVPFKRGLYQAVLSHLAPDAAGGGA